MKYVCMCVNNGIEILEGWGRIYGGNECDENEEVRNGICREYIVVMRFDKLVFCRAQWG